MADSSNPVVWEQVSDSWWSCVAGYVVKEGEIWVAHVYHNQRTGPGWTESQRGFRSAVSARRWVEARAPSD